jgi:hypothetical protein
MSQPDHAGRELAGRQVRQQVDEMHFFGGRWVLASCTAQTDRPGWLV